MARTEQVTCDVCGAQKQQTNHWFEMRETDYAFLIRNVKHKPYGGSTGVVYDLCGEACVIKKVSELIAAK